MKINFDEFEKKVIALAPNSQNAYPYFLKELASLTGANAATLWNCGSDPFVPIAQHVPGEAIRLGLSQNQHQSLLAQINEQQRSAVIKTDSSDKAAPTLLMVPLIGKAKRILELYFSRDHQLDDPQMLLKQLEEVRHCLERAESTEGTEEPIAGQRPVRDDASIGSLPATRLETLSHYAHAIHRSIDLRQTCASIANETRLFLNCDRISVALWHRGRYRLVAISGQPSVNHRSNTVQLLEKLADQALRAKREFWFPSEQPSAPQIRLLLDEYLGLSTTRSLVIQPIQQRIDEVVEDPEADNNRPNPIIAGIIYEHFQAEWNSREIAPTLSLLRDHAGDALRNATEHHGVFLLPLWKLLGKTKVLTSPRVLPKTVMVAGAALVCSLFLTFWPVEFYLSASGILVPQERQLIFPEVSGVAVSVPVKHGQTVQASSPLVQLQSEELQLRLADVSGRIETLRQRKSSIERSKFQGPKSSTSGEIDDNLRSLQAELDALQSQWNELEKMQDKLQIKSPMVGQVITWDVQQKLLGRMVTPQNVLMEIANVEGPWQLELDVEDHKLQHLLRSLSSSNTQPLKVQFSLSADPNSVASGTLAEVSTAMALNSNHQQVMQVKVNIDTDALPIKQAGSSVSAKIYTGEKTSAGYLWLHQIPELLNRYVFFHFVR